jgi:hypothetical protein
MPTQPIYLAVYSDEYSDTDAVESVNVLYDQVNETIEYLVNKYNVRQAHLIGSKEYSKNIRKKLEKMNVKIGNSRKEVENVKESN